MLQLYESLATDKRLYRLSWIWCYPLFASFHSLFSLFFSLSLYQLFFQTKQYFRYTITYTFNNRYDKIIISKLSKIRTFNISLKKKKKSKNEATNRFLSPLNRKDRFSAKVSCPLTFLSRGKHAPPEGVRSASADGTRFRSTTRRNARR